MPTSPSRSILLILAVATLVVATLAHAQTATDDFSTATNWSAATSSGNGALAISGGRVDYTSSGVAAESGSYITWKNSTFSYATSWEAQVDVHARAAATGATFDYFYGSLIAFRTGDALGQASAADKPLYTSMSADIIRPGGVGNGFQLGYSRSGDDWFELPAGGRGIVNSSTDAALRITYDGSTKVMTAYFDANGAIGGYVWTAIASIDIDGAQNFSMTTANTFTLALLISSGKDRLVAGDVYFDNFSVTTVTPPSAPTIATQPASRTVVSGTTTVFSVGATGSPAPAYQWRKDGTAITGATSAMLVLPTAAAAQAGSYTCVVTNANGTATSNAATLTISASADFGRIVNLSILTGLAAGEGNFTVGTVIGGARTTGTKPLLVRAVGPTLGVAPFNIGGVLPDPKLDLYSGSTVVASNDNWLGVAALSTAFTAVGAFPYANAATKDAAIFNPTLAAGGYTIQISDAAAGTGTVIAELYDSTPAASFTPTTPRLVNVSVLKQIPAGDILTAGFVIGGSTAKTVLIRVVGPTLGVAPFNIGGVMADPKLDLYSGSTVIASNDNWGGDAQLTTASNGVGAFALSGAASKDAVLLVTLPPGAYTAQASGVAGGGMAIIEVYEVP